jgi:hypothetical protein
LNWHHERLAPAPRCGHAAAVILLIGVMDAPSIVDGCSTAFFASSIFATDE